MASITDHIVEAVISTPPHLTSSSAPWNLYLDPFPDHIFPQLRSLKREIAKAHRHKQMDPVHWQSGIRPNRPFQPLSNNLYLQPLPQVHPRFLPQTPPPPPAQQARRQRQIPTQYYLEQAPFYAENFGPDPYAHELEVIQPTRLQSTILKIITVFSRLAVPGLNVLASLVFGLLVLARLVASWAMQNPVKKVCTFIGSVEWEVVLALALAWEFVKLLPGMGGEVVTGGGEGDGPVYTIFVKGRQAIGSGPVVAGSL
ncbi:hypothetical protein L207DRAFT_513392 [Hyaloscypha variabilis F]|uniref:Uncharacterized protein n=1 Tax=Hyaloscypha variabilis (strain UAMH 11265 / GT02V1 / F) TaxID=1149755 RepID=A0A2J6RK57_HYAVF|nr:hypothetical protein L207DRAFT_513392 [Hyaloscypha variabilis F]